MHQAFISLAALTAPDPLGLPVTDFQQRGRFNQRELGFLDLRH